MEMPSISSLIGELVVYYDSSASMSPGGIS